MNALYWYLGKSARRLFDKFLWLTISKQSK